MTRRITDGDDRKEQDNHAQTERKRQSRQNHREQLAEIDGRRYTEHGSAQTGRERRRQESALSIQLAVEQFQTLTEAAVKGMEGLVCEPCGVPFEVGDVCAPLPIERPPAEAESVLCAVVHKTCKDRARREAEALGMIQ